MVTSCPHLFAVRFDTDQQVIRRHLGAGRHQYFLHQARSFRLDLIKHLHGFQDGESLSRLDLVALFDLYLQKLAVHGCAEPRGLQR